MANEGSANEHQLTKREQYALAAMQGELASQSGEFKEYGQGDVDNLAEFAFLVADAMLRGGREE